MRSERTSQASFEAFALDHLTVIEATPLVLAETAARAGFRRLCTFVRSIDGLGGPSFDLTRDGGARAATRAALDRLGLSVDVAYPFTISDRTRPGDFEADLACAAELGARFVNLLVFARDSGRIQDETARFCERAGCHGLGVAIEMVPASTVRTLAQAAALVRSLGSPGNVGVNLDVLHLYRSGDDPRAVTPYRDDIVYLQICDGPLDLPVEGRRAEASLQRRLPGRGDFALRELLESLPLVPASVEIPDAAAMRAGRDPVQRARAAGEAASAILG
ncbi:sugar phosphate isomerase/epimerase family protein [Brevundimonas sp.]|uniref:sugar phosphate isomerase/epimerase family protein n=1 Tax=Brevundimonas sp. TaxID=1871086 RepID=UPI003D6D03DE